MCVTAPGSRHVTEGGDKNEGAATGGHLPRTPQRIIVTLSPFSLSLSEHTLLKKYRLVFSKTNNTNKEEKEIRRQCSGELRTEGDSNKYIYFYS